VKRLLEQIKVVKAIDIGDINIEGSITFYNVTDFRKFVVTLITTQVNQGKKVSLAFLQSKDELGTGLKRIGEPLEKIAGTGGEFITLNVEKSTEEMEDGYSYIAVETFTDDLNLVNCCSTVMFGDARNNPVE